MIPWAISSFSSIRGSPRPTEIVPASKPRHAGRLPLHVALTPEYRFSLTVIPCPAPETFMNQLFFRRALLIMTSLSALFLTAADTAPAPPVAKKVPHETNINGHKMVDNYYWLREKSNP